MTTPKQSDIESGRNENTALIANSSNKQKEQELNQLECREKQLKRALAVLNNERNFFLRHPYLSCSVILSTSITVLGFYGLMTSGYMEENAEAVSEYNATMTPDGESCGEVYGTEDICVAAENENIEKASDFCYKTAQDLCDGIKYTKAAYINNASGLAVLSGLASTLAAYGFLIKAALKDNDPKYVPTSVQNLFADEDIRGKGREGVKELIRAELAEIQANIKALRDQGVGFKAPSNFSCQFFSSVSQAASSVWSKWTAPSINDTPRKPGLAI